MGRGRPEQVAETRTSIRSTRASGSWRPIMSSMYSHTLEGGTGHWHTVTWSRWEKQPPPQELNGTLDAVEARSQGILRSRVAHPHPSMLRPSMMLCSIAMCAAKAALLVDWAMCCARFVCLCNRHKTKDAL